MAPLPSCLASVVYVAFFLTWLPVLFVGAQKTAVAVALIKGDGKGLMKVNGCPIELLEPEILRVKVFEPLLLLGQERFAGVDMRIRVRGGGYTSQIYAIRQAIAKGIVAYYQKCTCACFLVGAEDE